MKKININIIIIILLSLPLNLLANSGSEYTWSEYSKRTCPWSPPYNPYCCLYSKTVSYNNATCELTESEETPISSHTGECDNIPMWPPAGGPSHYPTDDEGNPLPSIGGCGDSTIYYSCSSVYQKVNNFSNQFSDLFIWWYFTSTGSDGNSYRCLSFYKNYNGNMSYVQPSDYHTVDPSVNSNCLSDEAFKALNDTNCNEQTNAYNSGIYTVFDDPDSTYECFDGNSDGVDDVTGTDCIVAAMPRPYSNLGDEKSVTLSGPNASCANGSPIWKINAASMNIYITDIPLWYEPQIGTPISIQLSYNSQGTIKTNAPFGNKWVLGYSSFLEEDESGNVAINMPDGRLDLFTHNHLHGYTKPFGVFNTLTKLDSDHFELEFPDGTVNVYKVPTGTSLAQPSLVAIRDAYGQELSIGYNADNLMETITDATGKTATLYYNAGKVDRIEDQFGRSAQFLYDDNNNLIKITDMGGYWTRFTYDINSYVKTIENAAGTWSFDIEHSDETYNSDTYPAPGQTMWENYRITITDPLGNKEEYYYHGPYTWYVSPRDYVRYTDRDTNNFKRAPKTYYYLDRNTPEGRIKKIYYPEGGYIRYAHDQLTGKPSAITDFHGSGIEHTRMYSYNDSGQIITVTDAKGNVTEFDYYPGNIDLKMIRLDLAVTPENDGIIINNFTYNGNTHNISAITDRLGIVTEFNYNAFGQLFRITQAKETAAETITELVYDSATHNLRELKKNGVVLESFAYDNIGRIKTHTGLTAQTLTYDYNNLNKIIRIAYPDNKFETIDYSNCCPHLIKSRTARSGLITNYTYDALKRLIKIQDSTDTTQYEYDANGNLSVLIDAKGNETSFEYDLDNRLINKSYTDGTSIQYAYDLAGLPSIFHNSRNIAKVFSFDTNHNIISINYSDSTPDLTYTYDEYDRLETTTNATGSYHYNYDDINRITGIDGPWANDTISFQYNELSRLKNLIIQNGQSITYVYDTIGRLTEIRSGDNIFTYDYEGNSPIVQALTRPNGSVTEYDYNDPLRRLTDITNRTEFETIVHKHSFAYNNLDLTDTEIIEYGNTISSFQTGLKTYDYNIVNQLVNSENPSRAYIYDDDGNLTRGYTPEGYMFNASYDAENRLTTLQYVDSEGVSHKNEYYYSGDGLLAKLKNFENNSLVKNIQIIRAGFLPVQERDSNNKVLREYTWGIDMAGGIGGLLNLHQNGQDYNYLYDGKGNVMALIDSSGDIVASYRYDAFGNLLSKNGNLDQPFKFSTKRYDESAGLYYYGYRFYSPSIGRWITRDPLGETGGINLYSFVENNPINFVDPWGWFGKDVHYDLTYKLSIDAGFSEHEAQIIANANQGLDDNIISGPFNPFGGTQLHFMSPENARAEVEKAIQSCDINSVGQSLHMLQDTYSHYRQGYRWYTGGHIWDTKFNKPSVLSQK